ncbi:DUF3408 domain-containing protein [Chryseobacterium gallinarum]|nr:DUF3408 domain-containing protein [Chryseobacterium gallinarum]
MKKKQSTVEVTVKLQRREAGNIKTYERMFLKKKSMDKRGEKSIYVRQEYHERLSRIAQVIGGDKIPLYALLDNILTHHFDAFSEILIHEFKAKSKPLF